MVLRVASSLLQDYLYFIVALPGGWSFSGAFAVACKLDAAGASSDYQFVDYD
jgi:hypothetical protein